MVAMNPFLSTLQTQIKNFKTLNRLKLKERISFNSEGAVEIQPAGSAGVALGRYWYNKTTEEDLDFLQKKVVQSVLDALTEKSNFSASEVALYGKEYLRLMAKLKKNIEKSLEVKDKEPAGGLRCYQKTVSEGLAEMKTPSADKLASRKQTIDDTIAKIQKEVLSALNARIEKLAKIDLEAQEQGLASGVENLIDTFIFKNGNRVVLFPESYSTLAVRTILSKLYGPRVVDETIKFYQLDQKGVLSIQQINALLIGILANLNPEDFRYILQNQSSSILKKFQAQYHNNLPTKFESLTEAQFCAFLEHLRKVNKEFVQEGKWVDYVKDDKSFGRKTEGLPYTVQLVKDKAYLHVSQNNTFKPAKGTQQLQKFCWAEHLLQTFEILNGGPNIQYSEAAFLTSIDSEGRQVYQNIYPIFSGPYLNVIGLVPFKLESRQEIVTIRFVFGGPAMPMNPFPPVVEASFEENKKQLQPLLLNKILKFVDPDERSRRQMHIELLGHGYGAGQAQECLVLLAEMIQNKELPESIASIHLVGFQSVGVKKALTQKFISTIKSLDRVSFNLRYFDVFNDKLARQGDARLGFSAEALPSHLNVSCFQIEMKGEAEELHRSPCLIEATESEKGKTEPQFKQVWSNNKSDLSLNGSKEVEMNSHLALLQKILSYK